MTMADIGATESRSVKQQLARATIRLLKRLMGNDRALEMLKRLIRQLPYRLAFPVTWVCLEEFPLTSVAIDRWRCAYPRQFPQVRVTVNPNCLSGRFFAISGYYEDRLTDLIQAPERDGLLVDIGANFGYYPVLWLAKRATTRTIVAEPVSEYVQLLQENLKPYQSRFQIFAGCIGDYEGTALVDTVGDPTMLSKVVTNDPTGQARQVPMLTLAALLAKYGETTVDVLKVDAEGYDLKILASCKPLFERHAIHTVFWETAKSEEQAAMEAYLRQLGYVRILTGYVTGYDRAPAGLVHEQIIT
ncbi:MAG: FkbM family methyltransferase [Cyanobacteria bacterium]|nr:FkbM family methyltransferase [Cyanobacteriota bacterium]MDW8200542.1 FkbM family methyltransferase [Cyanobacteriota bacterium SKYGB_h_bin112]